MKPKGGKRPGAGRKPGIKNKVTAELKARLLADGEILPLEFLLKIMRAPEPTMKPGEDPLAFVARWRSWQADRLDAAKAACPYIHPKLESIEHKGDPNNPIETKTSLTVEFIGPA